MDQLSKTQIIASKENWIEGEAVEQLERTAELPGMQRAIGMPDLHPGKGTPIGAAFLSEGIFYPYLVGNDIGCGMGLWQTQLKQSKLKRDRWEKKLTGFEEMWEGEATEWLAQEQVQTTDWNHSLGTIGGGNHFAELQKFEEIKEQTRLEELGIDGKHLMLLVHSGSRGYGELLLRAHIEKYKSEGLNDQTEDARQYLQNHNDAVKWAKVNRSLIAHRFFDCLSTGGEKILDVCHNSVTPLILGEKQYWLHRKGAAPSDEGPVVIPGSRGAFSYLVEPIGEQENNGFSLAHGAGRKWRRGDTKKRLRSRYTSESLTQTELGSKVICEDKELLYEEAPQAYKDIDIVVQDLKDAGLLRILAILRPLITYKVRKRS